MTRPFANALELLRAARLRPTRQRLALARLLFEKGDRHVAAEQLHEEALAAQVPVSLATVYNTLHQFVASDTGTCAASASSCNCSAATCRSPFSNSSRARARRWRVGRSRAARSSSSALAKGRVIKGIWGAAGKRVETL